MRKFIALTTAVGMLAAAGLVDQVVKENVITYGTQATANQGFFVTVPFTDHWCGYESRGATGFFCDSD